MRWLIDHPSGHSADPADIWLYKRVQICRAFPQYKLHELKGAVLWEAYRALQLLTEAEKALS